MDARVDSNIWGQSKTRFSRLYSITRLCSKNISSKSIIKRYTKYVELLSQNVSVDQPNYAQKCRDCLVCTKI